LTPHRPVRRRVVSTGLVALAATLVGASGLASQQGRKVALIIAIGEYGTPPAHPVTREPLRAYRKLNAGNDVALVRGALEHHGFRPEDIAEVRDAEANVEGIRAALGRLVRGTEEGDVIVIHYSGHGHRITNDNPDTDEESDGFDEVLVPYGAPDEFYEGYDGALHFRDDELGDVIAELRARAGREGNVTVFLDACYSGTGTRGNDDLPARGGEDPLGPPAHRGGTAPGTRGAAEDADGTGIDLARGAGSRGGEPSLASFAVFSAASQRQMAYETWDVDGRTKVGSLSYAIARTLPELAPGTTYRALFAAITRSLSGKVVQTPQMEGDADTQVFSNRLTQQLPYVMVDSIAADALFLAGGSLLGLNSGTTLLVHREGTARPDQASALATIRVSEASPTRARAEVLAGAAAGVARGAWAFVTARSYGDLALRVELDASLQERDRSGLERVLGETGIVAFVDEGADVVIAANRNGAPEARTTSDGQTIATGAQRVRDSVEELARNRYLRRISFASPELDIVLDFAPVEVVRDRSGRATACAPADWAGVDARPENLGGGQWRLAKGTGYRLRARNVGERRAFIHLVDLRPRGEIEVKRPAANRPAEELEVGGTMDLGCYEIVDDLGHEVLKLFATGTAQDLRPWFQTQGTRGGEVQALSREVSIHIRSNGSN
jgi:hypothetical protein